MYVLNKAQNMLEREGINTGLFDNCHIATQVFEITRKRQIKYVGFWIHDPGIAAQQVQRNDKVGFLKKKLKYGLFLKSMVIIAPSKSNGNLLNVSFPENIMNSQQR